MWPTVPTHLFLHTRTRGRVAKLGTQKERTTRTTRERVVLDKLARFKSNLSREGKGIVMDGGGGGSSRDTRRAVLHFARARAPNI